MTATEFERAVLNALEILRDEAPRKTGNLADHAIKVEKISDWEFRIYVSVGAFQEFKEIDKEARKSCGIAPYMPLLNDDIRNKHFNWWERAAENMARNLALELGGVVN